ncbi:MAG: cytochrome c5 family protein [Pseudomonadales bacterium]
MRRYRSAAGALVLLVLMGACGETQPTTAASTGSGAAAKVVDGEQVYNRYCFSCHAAGIAGAPKAGLKEAWQPRAAKGMAALLASTKAGIAPGMPAMGLCNNCTDSEFEAAISHMLDKSGVSAGP